MRQISDRWYDEKTIKAILILIMIMVVCMTVIACDKPNLEDEELPEEAEELTRTQIITNGTFTASPTSRAARDTSKRM